MNFQQNMDRIEKEINTIKLDLGHRQSQYSAWSSVRRSANTQYQVSVFPTSGKYYDFGGRKSRYASGQDAKDAEYYLTKVIPQEMSKLNARKAVLQQEQMDAIKAEELHQITRIQAEFVAEKKRIKQEEKRAKSKGGHPELDTTKPRSRRLPSGAGKRFAPARRGGRR